MEWPKYSAALSDMYRSLPVCVVIIMNPFKACKEKEEEWNKCVYANKFPLLTFNGFCLFNPLYTQARTHAYLKTWKHHLYITWGIRENTYATSLSLPLWVVVHGSKEALTLFLSVLCNNYPCAIYLVVSPFFSIKFMEPHTKPQGNLYQWNWQRQQNASGLSLPINDLLAFISNMVERCDAV